MRRLFHLRDVPLAALAAVLVLLIGLGARHQVDDGFERRHRSLDLSRPGDWARDPAAVAPGTLGRLLWPGTRPFEARLGLVEVGDLLKLNVRADRAGARVRLLLDGHEVVAGEAPVQWRQYELELPRAGRVLRLEQPGTAPVPIHLSRVSVVNVRGFFEAGPLALYLRAAGPGPDEPGRLRRALLALLAPTLLLLVAVWRRAVGEWEGLHELRPAVLSLLPAALVGLAGELVGRVSDLRLVYPARTLLVLLAAPLLLVAAWRARRRILDALRGLSARLNEVPTRLGLERLTAAAADARGGLDPRVVRRAFLAHLALVLVLGALFAGLVVRDFGGEMLGAGDLGQWVFQGYYVGRNLSFDPLPHLDLVNDQLFYPYGGNNVFQPWVLEMHLFTAVADHLLGTGPWVQVYFLLSVLVTAVGAFLLLVRDHGAYRASLVALAVSFCNYYAVGKYAGHVGLSCCHWMTLNLLADWLLAYRLVVGRPWSARLLALRALLLILALGQDLSYVAGIALTSFSLTVLFAVVVGLVRTGPGPRRVVAGLRRTVEHLRGSARARPLQVAALAAAAVLVGLLWVPLVLDVQRAAGVFEHGDMQTRVGWVNPLRLLIPVFPGFNPVSQLHRFHDSPEWFFASSPGLFFVLAGLAGLILGRKRLLAGVPLLLLLALFLSFHERSAALVRVLPWFALARVGGRFSLAYPAALAALSLAIPPTAWRGRRGRVLVAAACALLAVEAGTAYRLRLVRPRQFYRPTAAFFDLARQIRSSPGEALFVWPFCLAGGNGVGGGQVGRFYARQAGLTMFLQPFVGKKMMAKYSGRLHPDQIRPYVEAGWPRLFLPDHMSPHEATRQRRDFLGAEWGFIGQFFVLNDFCGMVLQTDLLPAATVEGFHERFGPPTAVVPDTPFGTLELIPKRPKWRPLLDPEAGRLLELGPLPPPKPLRRIKMSDPRSEEYLLEGWGGPERWVRSSRGAMAELGFSLGPVEPLELRMKATTFQRQRVRVLLNGVLVGEIEHDGRSYAVMSVALPAERLAQHNVLRFELPDAHSPQSVGVGEDTRVLGLVVEWVELNPVDSAPAGSMATAREITMAMTMTMG